MTVIAEIRAGCADELRARLKTLREGHESGSAPLPAPRTVHYAAWLIIPDSNSDSTQLVFESNYDGALEDHLDDLIKTWGAILDSIYRSCQGYPDAGTADPKAVKEFLQVPSRNKPSAAFFVALPGRSLDDLQNAIKVYAEAERYLAHVRPERFSYRDWRGTQHSRDTGFENLRERDLMVKLADHFRAGPDELRPRLFGMTRGRLWWRLVINLPWVILAALIALPLILLLPVIRLYEIREAQEPAGPRDPTAHDVTAADYAGYNTGMQNHLCTFATVRTSRFRRFLIGAVLTVGGILAKRLFIFGKLGAMASIHFARWIVFDDAGGRRVLFLSNFDGSWAGYLGDFSDLIAYGINAVWANVKAFTPTRFLFWRGAYNIEPYEQQVREHFQPVQLIYRAYGAHSVRNLQRYIDFRDRLARAIAIAEAREWRETEAQEGIERGDLQGLLVSGYDHLDHASYVFLRLAEPQAGRAIEAARAWLRSVNERVTTAIRPPQGKHQTCVNVAFTWAGLKAMGLPASLIEASEGNLPDGFPREFVGGIDRPEAAAILGDHGASASARWEFGGAATPDQAPHLLVLLYAMDEAGLGRLFSEICGSEELERAGLSLVKRQDCHREAGDRTEPFGFRDGIAQPAVRGLTHKLADAGNIPVATGEFVLGHQNEYGYTTRLPSVGEQDDPRRILWEHPGARKDLRAFGMNGTYLVFRKLSQDVDGFWAFVAANSASAGGEGDSERMELTAAKLIGRWRSGAPLALAPAHDVPALGRDNHLNNDFGYAATDAEGLVCPIGAHIRRANPRDSLPFTAAKSRELVRRHRLIRRGRKYSEYSAGAPADQGICFIALNGDLLRQFEFVQQNWLNDPTFMDLNADRDPIVGDHDEANGEGAGFTIQAQPAARRLAGMPRFVTVKGGGYFFMPGLKTLRFLAAERSQSQEN